MKKIILTTVLILTLAFSAQAAPQSIFSGRDLDHGGMGSFSTGAAMFNGDLVGLSGGRGQWIINHQIGLGFSGYSFYNVPDIIQGGDRYNMQVDFGGFDMEYFFNSDEVLHYSLYAMIGRGQITAQSESINFSDSDDYFSFYPQANAELNVTNWFRINAGVGYQLAQGVNVVGLDNSDLSGPIANVTFKFGKF
ncbi:porin family protein [bacterium]|nr:porin family protein [bacterium]